MIDSVVFIPGMMCDARIFAPQINDLSRDHPVQVASINAHETIRQMALAVLDSAPETFALVGLSMGGIVAMEILRQAPERVSRVALISTSPLAETPSQSAWREPQMARAKAGFLDEAMEEAMAPENLAPGAKRQEVLRMVREMAKALGPDVFIRQSRALQRRRDAQNVLVNSKTSALILCGKYDRLTPVKRHIAMAELIAHSKLVVLEDAGHLPTLEAAGATNQALRDWLGGPLMLR